MVLSFDLDLGSVDGVIRVGSQNEECRGRLAQ